MQEIKAYLDQYEGHFKIQKALHIAKTRSEFTVEATRIALDLAKAQNAHVFYQGYWANAHEVFEIHTGKPVKDATELLGKEYAYDDSYVTGRAQELHKLVSQKESLIQQGKTSGIKDTVRANYFELGDVYYTAGDLQNALKNYIRAKDFCAVPEHTFEMSMRVVKVALELRNFTHVYNYISKASAQYISNMDAGKQSNIALVNFLMQMDSHNYKVALQCLLDVPVDFITSNYSKEFILPSDVGLYASLLALAVLSRSEMRTKIIQNPVFKNFLELDKDTASILEDYFDSKYNDCLTKLANISAKLSMDNVMEPHLEYLVTGVRKKALIQFFTPYKSLKLQDIATAFNTDVEGIEKELSNLIADGQIEARIDRHNKILYAKTANQKVNTYLKALEVGDAFRRDTEILLLRVNMLTQNFIISKRSHKMDRDLMDYGEMRGRGMFRQMGMGGMGSMGGMGYDPYGDGY
eukprot:CAMPEP_0114990566 /NCGR_PEP_ID=MMETSP0216-20121206/10875_1 /TAXON_ID=223996 /ORGANISM="Protocruzia adherens, Strain Boccale" /LENGTH=464 /DNA_ID=CAMNT_0002353771 /DNA_START=99 /DNA_END=1493 /DNA_ORIENTATION=+